tara:strand:- start:17 stop:406 length:390 start_codon:yes stop_codon:yes gene_type:complete
MPNHTRNELVVCGKEKDVNHFLKHMGEENDGLDFNQIIPMPEDVEDSMGDSGITPLWRTWSCENWGTKWNAYDIEKDIFTTGDIKTVTYNFLTAWSPPEPIIEKLKKDWSDLVFYGGYVEEGYQSCGAF